MINWFISIVTIKSETSIPPNWLINATIMQSNILRFKVYQAYNSFWYETCTRPSCEFDYYSTVASLYGFIWESEGVHEKIVNRIDISVQLLPSLLALWHKNQHIPSGFNLMLIYVKCSHLNVVLEKNNHILSIHPKLYWLKKN